MDKLTALRVFRRVVERESFSRAARDLRISNAAASKNVRELEAELGAPLLQRTTRRLALTAVGAAYYERAVAILDDLAEADRVVEELSTTPRGLLRVAAPMSLGLTALVRPIADFLVRYPQLRVELDLNDRVVDIVREGYDVCIRGGTLADSSLTARKLAAIDRAVVASKEYVAREGEPRSPSQLAEHRCLLYSLSSAPSRWTFSKGNETQSVEVAGPLVVNSSLALVQAAVAGVGVAFVPVVTVETELADGRLVRLLPRWKSEPQALFAVYPRHREGSRKLRLFIEHFLETLTAPGSS